MQARISAKNAHAIAKAYDVSIGRKVKLSEQFIKHPIKKGVALVRAYATKHQDNYYLVYEHVSDGLAIMQEHCKSDDFCFRTFHLSDEFLLFARALSVINSCETPMQWLVAANYIKLVKRKLDAESGEMLQRVLHVRLITINQRKL